MPMKEEKVILVNEQDEVQGYAPKMLAHEQALLHRAFSVFIFNDEGKLLLQQRAAHKYHSPNLWTNTVCSHQRKGEVNLEAGKRRLREEMGMSARLKEVFNFVYKAPFDNGLTEHELDHVMIGFSNENPKINPDEVMAYRWESLENIEKDIKKYPGHYTEWFKIIFANSLDKLKIELERHFLNEGLKFKPIFKPKPWGGQKLKTILNKAIPFDKTGESWELSAVPNNYSIVSNGYFAGENLKDLLKKFKEQLTGKQVYNHFNDDFPLLIKYIDAADDLSIQVHPDDKMAKKEHDSFGKNELWHIIQADDKAVIYVGFKEGVSQKDYIESLKKGELNKLLRQLPVKQGDTIFIPAGTVHAIGKGVLLAEVQQTSDATYRIFDWNRMGLDGKPRELHTDLALKAMDFNSKPEFFKKHKINTPYFKFEKLIIEQNRINDVSNIDSFVILMNINGRFKLNNQLFNKGETILFPAMTSKINIQVLEAGEILKIYL